MTSRFLRNVLSGWVVYAAAVVAGFFLTPYILHRVGTSHYGLWVLAASLSGYLGLFDLGWAPAVTTRIAATWATGDRSRAATYLNAALWLHLAGGMLAGLVAIGLAAFAPAIFTLTPEEAPIATQLILITGLNVAAGVPLSVLSTALSGGLFEYDLANAVDLAALTLRVAGTIAIFESGGSIVMLAWAILAISLLAHLTRGFILKRRWPEWRIHLPARHDTVWREYWSFSGWGTVLLASERLQIYLGALIVGARFSASAAAVWGLAAKWGEYLRILVRSASDVHLSFLSSQSHSSVDVRESSHRQSVSFLLGVSLIIAIPLWMNGATVLHWWVGDIAADALVPMRWLLLYGIAAAVGLPTQAALIATGRIRAAALGAATAALLAAAAGMTVPAGWNLPGLAAAFALPIAVVWIVALPWILGWALPAGEFASLLALAAIQTAAQWSTGAILGNFSAPLRVMTFGLITLTLLLAWLAVHWRRGNRESSGGSFGTR
jgi:O-antigen/teichoic acid export membrane protein